MKRSDMGTISHAAMMATALMVSVFGIGSECYGNMRMTTPVNSDTTTPGPGTGFAGKGKGPAPVILGKSGDYVILAETKISSTGTTAITGDIGMSPNAGSSITGFSLVAPPSTYATSPIVTGWVFAADYDAPTPSKMTTAVLDMQTAYTDAAGRAPDYIELGAGNIGGKTLAPAVYKWGTSVLIPSDVTLSGGPNDVWIFMVAGDVSEAPGVAITLAGGALAKNIFWQVAGAVDLETTAHFEGVVLSQTAIVLKTGATANGRLLAQTAVVLDANTVKEPAGETTGILNGTAKNTNKSGGSGNIAFVPMGARLALDLGLSASRRTVSIFDMNGTLRKQVSVPIGQARIFVSSSFAPANGFLFQVK